MSHLPFSEDILSLQFKLLNPVSLLKGKEIDSEAIILSLSLIHAKTTLLILFHSLKSAKLNNFFSALF